MVKLAAIGLVSAFLLFILYCLWSVYCFGMVAFFGEHTWSNPPFLAFCALWCLTGFFFNRGLRSKKGE